MVQQCHNFISIEVASQTIELTIFFRQRCKSGKTCWWLTGGDNTGRFANFSREFDYLREGDPTIFRSESSKEE